MISNDTLNFMNCENDDDDEFQAKPNEMLMANFSNLNINIEKIDTNSEMNKPYQTSEPDFFQSNIFSQILNQSLDEPLNKNIKNSTSNYVDNNYPLGSSNSKQNFYNNNNQMYCNFQENNYNLQDYNDKSNPINSTIKCKNSQKKKNKNKKNVNNINDININNYINNFNQTNDYFCNNNASNDINNNYFINNINTNISKNTCFVHNRKSSGNKPYYNINNADEIIRNYLQNINNNNNNSASNYQNDYDNYDNNSNSNDDENENDQEEEFFNVNFFDDNKKINDEASKPNKKSITKPKNCFKNLSIESNKGININLQESSKEKEKLTNCLSKEKTTKKKKKKKESIITNDINITYLQSKPLAQSNNQINTNTNNSNKSQPFQDEEEEEDEEEIEDYDDNDNQSNQYNFPLRPNTTQGNNIYFCQNFINNYLLMNSNSNNNKDNYTPQSSQTNLNLPSSNLHNQLKLQIQSQLSDPKSKKKVHIINQDDLKKITLNNKNVMVIDPSVYENQSYEFLAINLCTLAKDQAGCRYLQDKIDLETKEALSYFYPVFLPHIIELSKDSFGNYLVQKICDNIPPAYLRNILSIFKKNIISIGMNSHGTRVVQHIITLLRTSDLLKYFIDILTPSTIPLLNMHNGSHIIYRFIDIFPNAACPIYNMIVNGVEILAKNKHGVCVVQKFLEAKNGNFNYLIFKKNLLDKLVDKLFTLVTDQFANYLYQTIITLGDTAISNQVALKLAQNFYFFSMHKYSSNVVEKCLDYVDDNVRNYFISIFNSKEAVCKLILDEHGNYVVQKLLTYCSKEVQDNMLRYVIPLIPDLKKNKTGEKVVNRLMACYPMIAQAIYGNNVITDNNSKKSKCKNNNNNSKIEKDKEQIDKNNSTNCENEEIKN